MSFFANFCAKLGFFLKFSVKYYKILRNIVDKTITTAPLWPSSSCHCKNAARQAQNGPFAAPKPVWVWDPCSRCSLVNLYSKTWKSCNYFFQTENVLSRLQTELKATRSSQSRTNKKIQIIPQIVQINSLSSPNYLWSIFYYTVGAT